MTMNPGLFNTRRPATWLGLAALIALMVVTIGWLVGWVQRDAIYAFDSDEGLHAYEALRISAHLRDGDLAGAMAGSLRQSFYPPVHPWLLGIALTFLDATRSTVRLFNLVLYALDVLLLYLLGQWLARDTRRSWLAGLAAALPALVSPPLWINGSLVYFETLGVLFMLVVFWGYWQGVAGRKWGWFVAGLCIVAAGLTKYPYWLFLIIPLPLAFAAQVVHSPRSTGRHFLKPLVLMVLPSAAVMLAWVAWPVTRGGLADYIAATRDLAETARPSLLENLIFYLKSIWVQFSPSPLMAMGLAVAFIASLVRWHDDRLRPLAAFFAWHLVGITTHGDRDPRYFITAMPALWLMGGTWAARAASAWPQWIAQLQPRGKWAARIAMWTAIIALALTSVLGLAWRVILYPTLYMLSLETDPRAEELYRWTAEQIPFGPVSIGLVNDWDQMSGPALAWQLTTRRVREANGAPRRADLVTVWEMHRLPETTSENVAALRDQMNARGLNMIVAYTAPGVGIKRLQGTIAALGDTTRLLGERDFPLRWYWPDKLDHQLYDGESLGEEQLREAIDQLGTDRSLTVHIYAYSP